MAEKSTRFVTGTEQLPIQSVEFPHNFDAEQALLGAILLNNRVLTHVASYLRKDDFADPTHGRIYAHCVEMMNLGQIANPISLKNRMADDEELAKLGGTRYLARLAGAAATTIAAPDYARLIVDLSHRRQVICLCAETMGLADQRAGSAVSARELIGDLVSNLLDLESPSDSLISMDAVVENILADLEEPAECFSTGLPRLDIAMGGGIYPGKLYGLIAQQKVGKSALMATISYNLARPTQGDPVPHVYLCLEMDAEEIGQRLIARHIGRNALDFMRRDRRDHPVLVDEVRRAQAELKGCGLYFQPKPRMSIDDVRVLMRRISASKRIGGVVLDQFPLVTGQARGQSQAEHFDNVAQTLVEACKQYGLWIVTAAQLNREGNIRGGDGLLNACDMTFTLHPAKKKYDDEPDKAWLEMRASRYTPYAHVGSDEEPAYQLVRSVGPYFHEFGHGQIGMI